MKIELTENQLKSIIKESLMDSFRKVKPFESPQAMHAFLQSKGYTASFYGTEIDGDKEYYVYAVKSNGRMGMNLDKLAEKLSSLAMKNGHSYNTIASDPQNNLYIPVELFDAPNALNEEVENPIEDYAALSNFFENRGWSIISAEDVKSKQSGEEGLRVVLSKNGNAKPIEEVFGEIKMLCSNPEGVFLSKATHRYAPEISYPSIVILTSAK